MSNNIESKFKKILGFRPENLEPKPSQQAMIKMIKQAQGENSDHLFQEFTDAHTPDGPVQEVTAYGGVVFVQSMKNGDQMVTFSNNDQTTWFEWFIYNDNPIHL